jgi:hypothetical protein
MNPRLFQAAALKSGLRLYLDTGIKPNSQWTLKNMLRTAGDLTGKAYTRMNARDAVVDLQNWINELR